MHRFWRSLLAGGVIGATLGTYFYLRSNRRTKRNLASRARAFGYTARKAARLMSKSAGMGVNMLSRRLSRMGNR